ncbi:MAG: DUF2231 domain-containing protein, partial [Bacteroidales bacterium]
MFSTTHFHPMVVHFPVALILAGFLAEVAYLIFKKDAFSVAGFWLLVLGAISACAAYLTGKFFTGDMSGAAGEIKGNHELFATITLVISVATAGFRIYLKYARKGDTRLRWVAFGFYAVAAIAVSITGFFGGVLVYNYMM